MMDEEYQARLQEYRDNAFYIFVLSVSVTILLNAIVWRYTELYSTLSGKSLVLASAVFALGPVLYYILHYRCPRCGNKLINNLHYRKEEHAPYYLWVAENRNNCTTCGLAVEDAE